MIYHWYDNSYIYRRKVTIHYEKVVSNLNEFPVAVQIDWTDNIFSHALANGYDIVVTASDGITALDYERSVWDIANNLMVLYVNVPLVSHTIDTIIYIYYGNSSASTDPQNATAVWDENFRAVYHFEENPYTTTISPPVTGILKDSTANGFNLSIAGTTSFPADRLVSSVMGNGWSFEADAVVEDQNVTIFGGIKPAAFSLEGIVTCTVTSVRTGWIYLNDYYADVWVTGALNCGEPYGSWIWWNYNVANGITGAYLNSTSWFPSAWTDDYDLSTARHIAYTALDGGNFLAYVDGTSLGNGYADPLVFSHGSTGADLLRFAAAGRTNDANLTGVMTEVRISDIVRSASWITTSKNNLMDNATFLAIGVEEGNYSLSITIVPEGGGTVTCDPVGDNGNYAINTVVSLEAEATSAYTFEKWTGDITGTDTLASITMDTFKSVTANFEAPQYFPWPVDEVAVTPEPPNYQIIPLDNSPNQNLEVSLNVDGSTIELNLNIYYNEMAGYWVMRVMDSSGATLVEPIPLITGQYPAGNLLVQHAYLKIGSAYLIPTTDATTDYPDDSDSNLGTNFLLVWGDTPS